MNISAPGKTIIIGEYVVLEGGVGIVLGVNRRCKLVRGECVGHGLVEIARQKALGQSVSDKAIWKADTSAFYEEGKKIGLGSSGAVAVCGVASVFYEQGFDIRDKNVREMIWAIAKQAHDQFQGEEGSGIDILGSCFGGFMLMEGKGRFKTWRPTQGYEFVWVWTGKVGLTPHLLKNVRELKKRDMPTYNSIIKHMAELSTGLAMEKLDMMHCFREYYVLMQSLGRFSKVDIVTEEMEIIEQVARSIGGVAKPSGAGGGDLMICAFTNKESADQFSREISRMNFKVISLKPDYDGVYGTDL